MKESENRVKESEFKLWKREQDEERKKKDHLRDRNQLILQQDFLKQMSIMPEIEKKKRERGEMLLNVPYFHNEEL